MALTLDRRAELETITGMSCLLLPFTGTSQSDRSAAERRTWRCEREPTLHLLLDPAAHVLRYREQSVALSRRGFALLHCLAQHGGWPVRAEHIMNYVW